MSDRQSLNKWRLILGKFSEDTLPLDSGNKSIDSVLDFLYSREYEEEQGIRKEGGNEDSQLTVPSWINKVRDLFPKEAVEIMQKQAISKYKLNELLTDEKILKSLQPDMELLKNILTFKNMMNPKVLETARRIIAQVVEEIEEKLRKEVIEAFTGKKNPYKNSSVKTIKNFDFKKTIRRNLKNYSLEHNVIIPSQLFFSSRIKKRNEYHIIIAVDQSGSMLSSVIYSAVMAGIFSKVSSLKTSLIVFDTNIVDLSDRVSDPVETLLSVQLGGGTDIAKALDYSITKIEEPTKTIVVLVSDLYDGNPYEQMYRRVHEIVESGAKMFVLPALDYECNGSYDRNAGQRMASLGADVALITPKELAEWVSRVIC